MKVAGGYDYNPASVRVGRWFVKIGPATISVYRLYGVVVELHWLCRLRKLVVFLCGSGGVVVSIKYPFLEATQSLASKIDSGGRTVYSSNDVASICHFFNISNPSSEDMLFLLYAKNHGFTEACTVAVGLHWKCGAAIAALEKIRK